jgi:hypothetical protein
MTLQSTFAPPLDWILPIQVIQSAIHINEVRLALRPRDVGSHDPGSKIIEYFFRLTTRRES